jgi:DNA polymerase-3 subunit delta
VRAGAAREVMAAAKTKAQAPIRAVLGSDESEVKRAARELADAMTPADGGDFACDVIDGAAENADQAAERIHQTIEALLTFPFFGGEKLVWLKNATFLADDPTGRSQGVLDALEKLSETLAGGIPDGTRFLLSAIGVDKRRTFYKALGKVGKVDVFDRLDVSRAGWEELAAEIVESGARRRELRFSADALELFTLYTGGDRRMIENEMEKLDLFIGRSRRDVRADDVRQVVPLSRAGIVFELGNALAERDLNRALSLLDQLLFQGESPIGILLVAIIPTVRNLLVVKDLMARHRLQRPAQPFFFAKTLERLPEHALAHLPRKKDGTVNAYALGIAAQHADRHTPEELRRALDACLEANVQLVTSGLEPSILLSQLLVRIVAGK